MPTQYVPSFSRWYLQHKRESLPEHLRFLDDLRESGGMRDPDECLQQQFGLSKQEARAVVSQWLRKFPHKATLIESLIALVVVMVVSTLEGLTHIRRKSVSVRDDLPADLLDTRRTRNKRL